MASKTPLGSCDRTEGDLAIKHLPPACNPVKNRWEIKTRYQRLLVWISAWWLWADHTWSNEK